MIKYESDKYLVEYNEINFAYVIYRKLNGYNHQSAMVWEAEPGVWGSVAGAIPREVEAALWPKGCGA